MGLEDSKLLKKYIDFGEKKAGSTWMGIMVGLFAAFGGILFGYDTGTIGGIMAMPYVLKTFPANGDSFTSTERALIVSILSVGTFFGALTAPIFSDRLGRRLTLIIATFIIFNLGVILQTITTAIPLLVAGRCIAGFGVGFISAVIPLYQAETAPKWIRGAIVSCYQLAITIGLLLAACVNQGTHSRDDTGSYRIPIAIQLLWSLILGGGMVFLPETPRFWVSRNNEDKAKDSLRRLRRLPIDHPDLVEEYDEINANHLYELQFGNATWLDVFSKQNRQRKRIIMGTTLQALQQLTGVNFIFYYGPTFFKSSGIDDEFLISLATNIVSVGMTFFGISFIEIIGRRKLLMTGSLIMGTSQYLVAIIGVAKPESETAAKVLIAFVCIFIAGFAISWGPLCWAVIAETYPLKVRQKSVALCTASNWLWNWAIAYATPYLVDKGPGNADLGSKVFFIWGSFNFIGFVFVYFMVYETKGLSLEQIDEMYEAVETASKSSTFKPRENGYRDDLTKAEFIHAENTNVKKEVESDV